MGRHRPDDFVGWRLYRRAWALPVLALLVMIATSFRAEAPVASTLPPTLANEQAADLLVRAREFQAEFPDRRAGEFGAIDFAQWMREQFAELGRTDLGIRTVPSTTVNPATGRSVNLVNVEATLQGRTRELVVIHAHRDTADANGRGSDAIGQLALVALARELGATRDRRRTYMFVSTDGATLNGGGARSLATRLAGRGAVVAVIGLDRLGAGGKLRVDAAPSGRHAPPLGLVETARSSVGLEGGVDSPDGTLAQVMRLAVPVTLREHGQLVREGLPALTITAGDDQLREDGDKDADAVAVGAGLRSVQRLASTLDGLDRLQSAGKTWVATDQRVYRGWALKLLVASMLVPAWIAAVDLLVRHRRGWNLLAGVGTCARAMLAGVVSVAMLWLLGAIGLLPTTSDRPPNPAALDDVHWIGLALWIGLSTAAWCLPLARGPDWRRQRSARRAPVGADTPELVLAMLALVAASAIALSIGPYSVLFIIPALHAWLWLASRHVFTRRATIATWLAGLAAPALILVAVGARADVGAGSAWYALQLVQTRTVPPLLALLIGAGAGLVGVLLVAALGTVAHPALPRVRSALAPLLRGELPQAPATRGVIGAGLRSAREALGSARALRSSSGSHRSIARSGSGRGAGRRARAAADAGTGTGSEQAAPDRSGSRGPASSNALERHAARERARAARRAR